MPNTPNSSGPLTGLKAAAGPLIVSRTNPRYFTLGSDTAESKAVYLTGSHIWNNFHDGLGPGPRCADTPEQNDYTAYLDFLESRGHNFIRLWRWEQFQSQAAGSAFHLCMTPQPWPRTGAGTAKDGKPKFDLSAFDAAYFDRLRQRVIDAGNRGIYVAVMFFDGWGLHLSPAPDNVEGHPFHALNNVNGIGIESIVDYQVLPLEPRVQSVQERFIRKVIDTVQDLPNVLYEVANESSGGGTVDEQFAQMMGMPEVPQWGDSTAWQYWVIDVVKRYEEERGYPKHPIGMTMQFPVADQTKVNAPLLTSAADWISPGYDDEIFTEGRHPMAPDSPPSRWFADPPPADGTKVIITDTDHYAPGKGDALWAWKSFVRGHHPILMDFGIIDVVTPLDASLGVPPFDAYEPARLAMGDTRRYAERMALIQMIPSRELASTGYALASPGREYLVLQPAESGGAFTVRLGAGTYELEWFAVNERTITAGGMIEAAHEASTELVPPFRGPAVAYLTSREASPPSRPRR